MPAPAPAVDRASLLMATTDDDELRTRIAQLEQQLADLTARFADYVARQRINSRLLTAEQRRVATAQAEQHGALGELRAALLELGLDEVETPHG